MPWQDLPHSYAQAAQRVDTAGWALVNNPNPQDRLHLRPQPGKGATLGKYYNGAPVRVESLRGDWARVSILGESGWMMKKFLAFDRQMGSVRAAFPHLDVRLGAPLLDKPGGQTVRLLPGCTAYALALLEKADDGQAYWRVLLPDSGLTGYIRTSDAHEGEG